MERLLQVPGVNSAAAVNQAIRLAASNGHPAVVELLLKVPGVNATVLHRSEA